MYIYVIYIYICICSLDRGSSASSHALRLLSRLTLHPPLHQLLVRIVVCCSALQCIAVRCSVLQCVAVCCSAL